jgi:5-formyltetrahydrofolate cyclo-ligase
VTAALDEPPAPALDLILLPGVSFDSQLKRLGHGKGYYDRFISEAVSHALRHDRPRPMLGAQLATDMCPASERRTVALALREQIAAPETIPVEEHDWKVDLLVTPDGIIGEAGMSEADVLNSPEGAKGGRVSL